MAACFTTINNYFQVTHHNLFCFIISLPNFFLGIRLIIFLFSTSLRLQVRRGTSIPYRCVVVIIVQQFLQMTFRHGSRPGTALSHSCGFRKDFWAAILNLCWNNLGWVQLKLLPDLFLLLQFH
jgi:hypothetical protein